ncbi:hypothetical protein BJV77DRAFT_548041 [Russula vinacea]|nr:hypothetical protein BJV77DRAFT_548041 [Russula vinacea]
MPSPRHDGKPGALNGACWFPGFCAHKNSQRSHSPLSAWRLRHYSYIMGGHYLCRLCVQQGPHEGGGGERCAHAGIIIPILTSHAQRGHNDEETKGAVSALIAGLILVSVSSLREYAAIKEPAEGFLEACQCSEDVGDLGGSEVRKREENADG